MTEVQKSWLEFWQKLAQKNELAPESRQMTRYKAHARQKVERPDSNLDFVLQHLSENSTVLDIGAGSGRWTIPLAKKCALVTAVEPSSEMRDILKENIVSSRLNNVRILENTWEQVETEMHDFAVSAHSIYGSPDFAGFVHKMQQHTRAGCYLVLRLPPADGVMAELNSVIYGTVHDSPNAVIAYNALYEMGIYAGVQIEPEIYPWKNDTLEEAFLRAKRHLRLENDASIDGLVRQVLGRRLIRLDGGFVWPDGMRSALLWWKPGCSGLQGNISK